MKPETTIPGYLTVTQACEKFQRCRTWVSIQAHEGFWPGALQVYPGGPWLIPKDSEPAEGAFKLRTHGKAKRRKNQPPQGGNER